MQRQKFYSSINILGLAVGLTCSMLLLLWIQDESAYDRFHGNANQIYRVTIRDKIGGSDQNFAVTPIAMAPVIKNEIPEILYATRLSAQVLIFSHENQNIREKGLLVSPDFLKMFSFKILEGRAQESLDSTNKIMISEDMARRHFNSEDPMGRNLQTQGGQEFIVSGIIQNVPRQSHLQFDYLVNFQMEGESGRDLNNWSDISYYSYVMLQKGARVKDVAQKITSCSEANLTDIKPAYRLQSIKKLYLDPPYQFDNITHGSRTSVLAFSLIATVILIIACINYVNLSTARAGRRSKEVSLKKIIGASRTMLMWQFFGEAFLSTMAAFLLALGCMSLLMPLFNSMTGKVLSISILANRQFLLPLLSIFSFTAAASGLYPAFLLASYQPIKVIKGTSRANSKGAYLRKILIVFQFALTIIVITGVIVMEKQLRFVRQKDLGYDKSNLMVIPMGKTMVQQYETLKQRILQNPNITNATATANLPLTLQSGSVVEEWEEKSTDEKLHFKLLWVDSDYLDTFQMTMAEGQFFSKERQTDKYGFVVNQSAVAAMGMESPVGKRVVINRTEGTIIGVVKDFNFRSLHHSIEPVALLFEPSTFYNMVIRLKPDPSLFQVSIQYIKDLWSEFAPERTFSFSFLDDSLNRLYLNEQLLGRLVLYFTGLTIFIACLGLVGMAGFAAEQRTKEIGIRKVLGASTSRILSMLLMEFTKWVLMANAIAWPVAYVILRRWLQNYAYHTKLSLGIFLTSSLLALVVALITISQQSIRASLANPADSLRYE